MSKILRTPETRFRDLPGYGYAPHYLDDLPGYAGLRLHYLDEGPRAAAVFLCLHGEPTWSYLYRRMIPLFTAAGYRVIAPDFFGFGRSDKPEDDGVYTFDFHRNALLALIERLDLQRITLVCQDWGGLLGLTLPMHLPERFERLLVMNTALATGDRPLSPGWVAWRDWCVKNPDMAIGKLMGRSCPHLMQAECAAYDAPHLDQSYKAGPRSFPAIVPTTPDAPGAALAQEARDWWKSEWQGQSFMAIGMLDPVIGEPVMRALHKLIRNCPPPLELNEAGHFVQEWGERIVPAALASFASG